MTVILLLIPLSVVIATGFLGAFIWAVRSGQYDDTVTPSLRVLLPDSSERSARRADATSSVRPQSDPLTPRPSIRREGGDPPRSS